MDETGVALGVYINTRVLASSSKKKAYVKTPENREWVSIIECISTTGRKLRYAVIYRQPSSHPLSLAGSIQPLRMDGRRIR